MCKCASGEGHPLSVLTVTYPGGRTRQFSLRRERVPVVRRWLRQLSGPQGGNREHLRTQSRVVASGQNRVKGPEEEP